MVHGSSPSRSIQNAIAAVLLISFAGKLFNCHRLDLSMAIAFWKNQLFRVALGSAGCDRWFELVLTPLTEAGRGERWWAWASQYRRCPDPGLLPYRPVLSPMPRSFHTGALSLCTPHRWSAESELDTPAPRTRSAPCLWVIARRGQSLARFPAQPRNRQAINWLLPLRYQQ